MAARRLPFNLQVMPVHGPHRRATTAPPCKTRYFSVIPVNGALTQCGIGTSQMLNQGWYDNVLVVDPTDPTKWAGGVDLFRSDNGGVNWGVASYWWFQGTALHQTTSIRNSFTPTITSSLSIQTITVLPIKRCLPETTAAFSGPTMRRPATSATRTARHRWNHHAQSPICGVAFAPARPSLFPSGVWDLVNNGYAVTQFYHGLPYPNGQTYFGGTQDNGTNRGTDVTGPNAWARINGGDGGYVAVNPANTNTIFFETTGLSLRRSTNGGASSLLSLLESPATCSRSSRSSEWIQTPTRLWIGGRFMWRTDNNATN